MVQLATDSNCIFYLFTDDFFFLASRTFLVCFLSVLNGHMSRGRLQFLMDRSWCINTPICFPPYGITLLLEPANAEIRDVGSIPGPGRSLEEGMATQSSILAGRISWTEEPGRLQSTGLQRVGHDWSNWACKLHLPKWYLFLITRFC